MRFKIFLTVSFLCRLFVSQAITDPFIINWTKCTGNNGYTNQLSDVQKIEYSTNYVYITSTSVPGTYTPSKPGYSTTYPWADCPYVPVAQPTFRMKIPRNPTVASTNTAVPIGTFGILLNGVSLYNANDGRSYNNDNTCPVNQKTMKTVCFVYEFGTCVLTCVL